MDVRIPPHNLDAEKAVLGALLTNGSNSGAVVDTVTSILKSEDFYRDAHRIIYDAILEIVHANKTADFITVGEELDRRKRLDAVGGLAYITSLANESVSYNVEEHAKIISEKAQLRRLIDAGNKIVGMTYAGEDEPTAILNKAEQMVLDVSGQTQSESSFAPIGEVVLSNLDKLNALQQHDGAITGVPTAVSYTHLNRRTGARSLLTGRSRSPSAATGAGQTLSLIHICVFSTADSSIPALEAALAALRTGGVLSAILYSGRVIGTDEKQRQHTQIILVLQESLVAGITIRAKFGRVAFCLQIFSQKHAKILIIFA